MELPKVTFGIIVLNGEPYVRYCLRALYPFAHQIIIVEGAAPGAAGISTPEGHSIDGTLETIKQFQEDEDIDGKVELVVRDGYWEEKDQMSQAYAERATGDYLWQVDIDEFYKPEDMRLVLEMLKADSSISAVSFKQIMFWGGFRSIVDGFYLRRGGEVFHRLFKWGPGYTYKTHRPPTVLDPSDRDTRRMKWVTANKMAKSGVFMYHYAFVFPKQVLEKSEYYRKAQWAARSKSLEWAEESYLNLRRPYRVHNVYNHISWLDRYGGTHPPQIEAMRSDIDAGRINVACRQTDDIDRLLGKTSYICCRGLLKAVSILDRRWNGQVMSNIRSLPLRAARKVWRSVEKLT